MGILEDGDLPYSVLGGNHDMGWDTFKYLGTFPASRAASQDYADGTSSFVSATPDQVNTAHLFHDAQGNQLLNIAFSWFTANGEENPYLSDETIAWAQSVIDAHPGVPTIVTSHQILNVAGDGVTALDTTGGNLLWDRLINNNDQIFMTYSGHHHGAAVKERTNAAGHPVIQVLMDYQMAYMGGNGYMGLTEFDLTNNKISQTSFSPWVLEKPADTLTSFDQALLEGTNQSWTVDFDFASRFPGYGTGTQTPSATQALREHITSTYTAPAVEEKRPAADAEDYVAVDGTLAHWRMADTGGVADGAVLPVGSTITDIAAGNTFTRQDGVGAWAEDQVTYSSDHAPLSSDFGSVCFTGAGRQMGSDGRTNTANFFTTAAGAAINQETFPNGFTFETFIKIDPSYTVDNNRWMTWLGRDGQRQHVDGYGTGGDAEEPMFAWAFSNLNEVQFTFVDPTARDSSAWSGEIVNYTSWMHMAAVNDPTDQTVTLYINGEPVLRNTVDQLGIATEDLPWVLGAGSYAGVRESGFVGCIGETRIVDHVLTSDQWLTARAERPVVEPSTPVVEPTPAPSATPTVEQTPAVPVKPVKLPDTGVANVKVA